MRAWLRRWRIEREERRSHRSTAYNCRYWIGDNDPVDWGTCRLCPPPKEKP